MSELLGRLEAFRSLSENWDSYGSDPISPKAIAAARDVLFSLKERFSPVVGSDFLPLNVAPIADGGVQFEWKGATRVLEIEVTAEGSLAYFAVEGRGPKRKTNRKDEATPDELEQLVAWVTGR